MDDITTNATQVAGRIQPVTCDSDASEVPNDQADKTSKDDSNGFHTSPGWQG